MKKLLKVDNIIMCFLADDAVPLLGSLVLLGPIFYTLGMVFMKIYMDLSKAIGGPIMTVLRTMYENI